MDINDFRGIITVVIFVAFVGVWIWAWSSRRRKDFDESARLPLDDDAARHETSEEKS